MSHALLLLVIVGLTHAVTAGVWWSGGSLLGLSRTAAWHWLLAPLAHGGALALLLLHPHFSGWGHLAVADLLVLGGFIAMRRGLQWFMRKPRTDAEHHFVGFGALLYSLALCLPMNWQGASSIAVSVATAWVLARMLVEAHVDLGREFARATPWILAVPLGLAALAFAGRAGVLALAPGLAQPMLVAGSLLQDSLVVAAIAMNIALNFVLGYVVVMRLVGKLQHLSQHDALTGLLNRRAIEYLLDRETQRLQRFGEPYAVLLIDIDHFKRINDRLGHPAGDAVLASVARTLAREAREVDRVARYGGEEFCVLLPHTLRDGALQAGERMRDAIRRAPVAWGDEFIAVTISVGVAAASDPTEPLLALLHRADQALYRAKAEGRDRVVLSASLAPTVAPPPLVPSRFGEIEQADAR